jgi:4-amino-4-deoxy-L-arabinose transferase-like glycosyltransferase
MVIAGLLARVLYLVTSHCYQLKEQKWCGFEMSEIARNVAIGQGYILRPNCGPSAFTTPLYPLLVASIFRMFGVFSNPSAFVILTFNSAVAAFTSWAVYQIARRVSNETVAVWAGWIWAFLPSSLFFSLFWIWETTLSAFLLSALFLLTLRMESDSRLLSWCGYGLLWGVAGLTNPSCLAWLPFAGCWLLWQLQRRRQGFVMPVLLGAVVFWLTLTPWLARNYYAFDDPLLLRNAFGMNLRAGNNPMAEGWWVQIYTYENPTIMAQYKKLGESEFMTQQRRMAEKWIAQHPGRFCVLTCRRFLFFWADMPHRGFEGIKNFMSVLLSTLAMAGLVVTIRRHMPGAFLFTTLLIFYPLMYYITFPQPRYRHPIEPEMLILAVLTVWAAIIRLRARPQTVSQSSRSV